MPEESGQSHNPQTTDSERQTGDFAAGKIINLESGIWKQRDELFFS
jgi:hypothetical protein